MITSTGIVRGITGAEVEHYQLYGFVRLKRVLAEEEVERLRGATALALDTLEASPSSCDLTLLAQEADAAPAKSGAQFRAGKIPAPFCAAPFGSVRHIAKVRRAANSAMPVTRGHFLVDSGVWRRIDALRAFALHSELAALAAGLIEARTVRFYDDQLMVKEAGTRERTAFHQDLSYLHVDGEKGCVFTLFLDRVRHGAACPGYVPSSHRWGQVFKANYLISDIACPGAEGAVLPGIDNDPESFGVQYVEADPGDILVHHVLTIHGMEGNRGTAACRALAFCYVDAALRHRARPGVSIPPTHNSAVRDGGEMDPMVHPVVWPRLQSEALAG